MGVLNKLELIKDMVQDAIENGASTVEEVHRTIAEVPIDQLERSGLLDPEAADEKKAQHHRTVGTVYNAIRDVNRKAGEMASDWFAAVEDAKHVSDVMDENEEKK